ncbi:magnesium/cobalt transporter CorA [Lacibacter luteus]|uniref:Magnesium transport protein CorA n=1 Tax=Lacibacter luteus TaxID=2508719 RepID=A0A4V1M7N7_9BACT|nr:magnesium/cobalt transporter CorA [Lacibacter luteus]RXK60715.1 magnesium/cobalt transporter CorA [Lacibacter luteus]
MRKRSSYLDIVLNPFNLLRTKRILHVNPTVAPQRIEPEHINLYVYDYDTENLHEEKLNEVKDAFRYKHTASVTWINVDGIRRKDIEEICNHFNVHPLVTEDIMSIGQRPKVDEIDGVIFCLLNMLYFNEKDSAVETEQISIVLGKQFVLSFQEDASRDVFNPLRDKIHFRNNKLRQSGTDYLFYTLIDLIVDNYFVVMEKLSDKIEVLEEDIIRSPNNRSLAKINQLRKEMIVLKRNITPVRDMVNGILRSESELLNERTAKYFKDVYDHIVQAADLAENYRDMMMNLHDLYLSNVNLKMNEVMKVMAIVTCLLAPATVIGGMFGMNFDIIPYAHHQFGFYLACGMMILIPIVMLYIFRKRGWF